MTHEIVKIITNYNMQTASLQPQTQLIALIERIALDNYNLNLNFLKQLLETGIDHSLFRQIVNTVIGKHIEKELTYKKTLNQINEHIRTALMLFQEDTLAKEDLTMSQSFIQTHNKMHRIKYTGRRCNPFQGQEYFNSHTHLFSVLKKFSRGVKKTILPLVHSLLTDILDADQLIGYEISQRVDPTNLKPSINALIISTFPADITKDTHSAIETEYLSAEQPSKGQLAAIVNSQLTKYIDASLGDLRERNTPIEMSLDDWIEVDLSLTDEKQLKKSIILLEQKCKSSQYEMVQVGYIQKSSGVFMVAIVGKVCCKFNFYLSNNFRLELIRKYIFSLIHSPLGCALSNVVDCTKIYNHSVRDHLTSTLQTLQQTQRAGKLDLAPIIDFIDCLPPHDNIDSQSLWQQSTIKERSLIEDQTFRYSQKGELRQPNLQVNLTPTTINHQTEISTERTRKSSYEAVKEVGREIMTKAKTKIRRDRRMETVQKQKMIRFMTEQNDEEGTPKSKDSFKFKEDSNQIQKQIQAQEGTVAGSELQGMKIRSEANISQFKEEVISLRLRLGIVEDQNLFFETEVKRLRSELVYEQRRRQQRQREVEASNGEVRELLLKLQAMKAQYKVLLKEKNIETNKNSRNEMLLENRSEQMQLLKRSERMAGEESKRFQQQLVQLGQNQVILQKTIKVLKQEFQKAEENLAYHMQSQQFFHQQLTQLRKQNKPSNGNDMLLRKVTNIEEEVQFLNNQLKNTPLSSKHHNSSINLYSEPTEQTELTEQLQTEQESQDHIQVSQVQECRQCHSQRDKVRKAQQKLLYTSLIFALLFFEAVTFTFSVHLFR